MRVTPRITLIRGRSWKLGVRKVAASSRLVVMIQDVNQISQSAFRLATCRDACITTCHYISTCCASLGAVALSLLLNCETVAAPQIVKPAYACYPPSSGIRIVLLDVKGGIWNVSRPYTPCQPLALMSIDKLIIKAAQVRRDCGRTFTCARRPPLVANRVHGQGTAIGRVRPSSVPTLFFKPTDFWP